MAELHDKLAAAIGEWGPEKVDTWSDEVFDQLALEVFEHQFVNQSAYRRFCTGRGVSPDSVTRAADIPAVPTDVFKHVRLLGDADVPVRTFLTSGTTRDSRGAHHFATLQTYAAAVVEPFRRYCMPDRGRMTILALVPSPGELPESSLSFMLGELLPRFGHPLSSGFFVARGDDGELDFDWDGFVESIEASAGPIMVFATAFALVELFDTVDAELTLPPGSRVIETGGLKGRSREVERAELYDLVGARFGVEPQRRLSEYGMTELSSQAYTDALVRGVSWREARFRVPPWVRIRVLDPVTQEPVAAGQSGLICWHDLANVDSNAVVLTSDIGVAHEDGGFELLGRASGAELRGCSLTVEEILGH